MAPGTLNERLAVAAHLHVMLRRKHGRVTDTEWMAMNELYARTIIALARAQADDDLHRMAARFEAVMFGTVTGTVPAAATAPIARPQPAPVPQAEPMPAGRSWSRYVGGLR
ncbi:MAG: hypothetical protein EOP40_09005 [Rubrivivax sp.]|nr:MAG: hypothetical protein EOP40_09005 [Rubrivivax sp.]